MLSTTFPMPYGVDKNIRVNWDFNYNLQSLSLHWFKMMMMMIYALLILREIRHY